MSIELVSNTKTITKTFKRFNTYDEKEISVAKAVLESGILSGYIGANCKEFFGGKYVNLFERQWEKAFEVEHAISVNSATSGLIVALGALNLSPGDEVIVSPWTMSASATAILVWNAIPVFADIEEDTFNLDPQSVEANIGPLTKAIVVPDIFGQSAQIEAIMAIAKKHNLMVIEDASQSPGAKIGEKYVGTVADIGVFSLNCHKHIHTGEGGVCVTNSPQLARRMQLIRNHAEAVVAKMPVDDFSNMMGFNFRLGELEAAIATVQLEKLPRILQLKQKLAERLSTHLSGLKGLSLPKLLPLATHVYYIYPMVIDPHLLNCTRAMLIEALQAEGVPGLMAGYCNLHQLPMYQQKKCYGSKHFPWEESIYKGTVSYHKGICPVAEKLHDETFLGFQLCLYDLSLEDIDLISKAFHKIWQRL